jgi:golgi SNAP receptor complex member 2
MTALQRLQADYNQKIQMEMDQQKRDGMKRKQSEVNERIESMKSRIESTKRSMLLSSPSTSTAAAAASAPFTAANAVVDTSSSGAAAGGDGMNASGLRERERDSIHRSITMVDSYIDQAQFSMQKLRDQHRLMKETQKRLLDAVNALGLSQDVIRWIERRSVQDMYIFWAGVTVIVLMFLAYLFFLR